jgi:hypothetical protein
MSPEHSQVGTVAPTQTRHPWRATARTVFAASVGLLPLLPTIVDQLGLATVPWVVSLLAVTGAITRVLAIPAVDAWLSEHARGLLAAQPRME